MNAVGYAATVPWDDVAQGVFAVLTRINALLWVLMLVVYLPALLRLALPSSWLAGLGRVGRFRRSDPLRAVFFAAALKNECYLALTWSYHPDVTGDLWPDLMTRCLLEAISVGVAISYATLVRWYERELP